MKRLNCTFEKRKDKNYPWLLKHPKVKEGLAKFKTRQDALEWYMLLDFETAIWFQDDKKIFAGQLTIDSAEDGEWYYYIKTASFDGEGTYEGLCRELGINPYNFKRDREYAKEMGKNLKEGEDYILISDPYTYFPPELEIKKRQQKDVIDIDAIRLQFQEQINILMMQLHSNNEIADKELELLKAELNKKDLRYEELANKINLLKESRGTLEGVTYEELWKLTGSDTVGAVALYTEKLNKIIESLDDKPISRADYDRIVFNFDNFERVISAREEQMDEKNKRLIQKLHGELTNTIEKLKDKLKVADALEDKPENQAYYINKAKKHVPVVWETSFVLVELQHVGFVPYDEYYHTIPYLAVRTSYSVTLVDNDDATQTVTFSSKIPEPSQTVIACEPTTTTQVVEEETKVAKPIEDEVEVAPKKRKIIIEGEDEAGAEPIYIVKGIPTAEVVIVEDLTDGEDIDIKTAEIFIKEKETGEVKEIVEDEPSIEIIEVEETTKASKQAEKAFIIKDLQELPIVEAGIIQDETIDESTPIQIIEEGKKVEEQEKIVIVQSLDEFDTVEHDIEEVAAPVKDLEIVELSTSGEKDSEKVYLIKNLGELRTVEDETDDDSILKFYEEKEGGHKGYQMVDHKLTEEEQVDFVLKDYETPGEKIPTDYAVRSDVNSQLVYVEHPPFEEYDYDLLEQPIEEEKLKELISYKPRLKFYEEKSTGHRGFVIINHVLTPGENVDFYLVDYEAPEGKLPTETMVITDGKRQVVPTKSHIIEDLDEYEAVEIEEPDTSIKQLESETVKPEEAKDLVKKSDKNGMYIASAILLGLVIATITALTVLGIIELATPNIKIFGI